MADSMDDEFNFYDEDIYQNEDQGGELASSLETNQEEEEWKGLELDKQCDDVLDLLSRGKRRWDRGVGSPEIPPLEEYKKQTLAERIGDSKEPTRMTALHCLARSRKDSKFDTAPPDVCREVIRFLLEKENRAPDTDAARPQEGREKMLILEVALFYENDKFIDCVDECLGDQFPEFLHRQDENKKNCLHHLFAWPKDRKVIKSQEENKRYVRQLEKLALRAKPATLATADKEGNTPIHYALHLEQCYDRDDEYLKIVKILILRADDAMVQAKTLYNRLKESPVMYYRRISNEVREKNEKKKKDAQGRQRAKAQQPTKEQSVKGQGQGPDSWTAEGSGHKMPQKVGNMQTATSQKSDDYIASPISPPEGYQLKRAPTMDALRDPRNLVQGRMLPPGKKREPPTVSTQERETVSKTAGGDTKSAKGKEDAAAPSNNNSKKMATCRLLVDFLRAHYTVTRSDLDARDLIFGRGADGWATNLYFDARGLHDTDKILEVLDRMQAGGFGATLSYVNIPAIRQVAANSPPVDTLDPMDRGHVPAKNPREGRTDLTRVFDKLHELSVRTIWRLEVEDRQSPSRTDATIEKSIQGREDSEMAIRLERKDSEGNKVVREPISVHIWDWRKPDLNTDVIAFAAPTVKVVNLYWSGNQTVLKAWGCQEGIPRLHSITGVEKIFIHATPGIETTDRMKLAVRRFKEYLKMIFPKANFPARPTLGRETKEKLKKRLARLEKSLLANETHPDVVEIEFTYHMGDPFANTDASEEITEYIGDDPTEKQHAWVDVMDRFRSALASVQLEPSLPRIRVALIDDGVNLGSVNMYGGIVNVGGLSFHTSDRHTGENPWHYSTGGHGTVMTNMILRINPWVDLFVIRLQCGVSHNQGRTISQLGAAQAIEAAIDLKVKIISVSWTIKYRGGTVSSPHPKEAGDTFNLARLDPFSRLTDAIDKVKKEGILMFCSASDDIQTTAMKVLPYSQQPEHIFRIGAALWLGQRDPATENQDRIDWFFPGNQVAEAKNPRAQGPVKYHDGSSVGTALAAGLASLVMFLARLVQTRQESEVQRLANEAKELRAKGNDDRARSLEDQAKAKADQAVASKKRAEDLEDRNKMKHALDTIGRKNTFQPDKKYLPVWDTFNPATEVLSTAKRQEEKWDELARLVETLCQAPN